ncbi:MAG: helix-turn-helix domain-containing protein, partial [Treponema sp.]|nr:helix-turn-helix domain-containing protein [Treponema sp.]
MEISLEKKIRILHLVENEGFLAKQAAKRCGVSAGTGYKIVKHKDAVKTFVFECSRMMDG